jgi:hypothetical protein
MHQCVKAMTVAGMIATGLPLLTEAANAQTAGWNRISTQYCESPLTTISNVVAPGSVFAPLWIWGINGNGTGMWVFVPDSSITGAMLRLCYDGAAFWGWYDNVAGWTEFYFYQGMR